MRLRFTIPDLLWLVVVVALAVGWWIEHRRVERRMEGIENAIRSLDANHRGTESTINDLLRQSGFSPKPAPPRPPVLPE